MRVIYIKILVLTIPIMSIIGCESNSDNVVNENSKSTKETNKQLINDGLIYYNFNSQNGKSLDSVIIEGRYENRFTVNQVEKIALYPECNKNLTKKEAIKCFSNNLNADIFKFLDTTYPEQAKKDSLKQIKVLLEFTADRKGGISNIESRRGYKPFKKKAIYALTKVADSLKETNTFIKPAEMINGEKVNLKFVVSIILKNPDFKE